MASSTTTYYENTGESSTTVPFTINVPATTIPVPNPLNAYSSYTYAWSLWWLSVQDFNGLMAQGNALDALAYPCSSSYVLAEDSGLYPNQRLPSTLNYNYQIQEVNFKTTIALNDQSGASNTIDGEIIILEPYGISLIDAMVAASLSGVGSSPGSNTSNAGFLNYTQQPYMLQLEFRGYDDNGNNIPDPPPVPLTKRFPIKITDIEIEFVKEGTQYKLHFVSHGQEAHHEEYRVLQKQVSFTAATVGDFFKELANSINTQWATNAAQSKCQFPDGIIFDVDPTIASQYIVDPSKASITNSNSNSVLLDIKKANFQLPAQTAILDIIDRTMALSGYINVQTQNLGADLVSQSKPTNLYKVMTQVEFASLIDLNTYTSTPTKNLGQFDFIANKYPKVITYRIHQYTTWSSVHPKLPQFADSRQYSSKVYNYLYTGQNTDIISFNLKFDFTYNKPILTSTSQTAVVQATKTVSVAENADNPVYTANTLVQAMTTPAVVARLGGYLPQLLSVPSTTPTRFRPIVNNQQITMGMGILNRPETQQNIDAIKSLYSQNYADQATAEITIIGDPTLLKQDDWLYHPSPSNSAYTLANGQSAFVLQYGHVNTDLGEVIATIIVNSVTDVDIDVTNQGYMYNPEGTASPLFVGQYRINTIDNSFKNGAFTQTLHLSRLSNSDYAGALSNVDSNVRVGSSSALNWATYAKASSAIPGSQSGLTQSQAASAASQSSANQRISTTTNQ
jgi:hypothetical protein